MKVGLTLRASQQLTSAYDYLRDANANAAATHMKRIFDAIDLLKQHPFAGREGRIAGTREMVVPRTPFIVAYTVLQEEIQVLAVLHGSRRWPKSL